MTKRISTTAKSASSDDAPKLKAADFKRARFSVGGQDANREQWQEAVRAQLGKQRVTIMLDSDVVAFFKAKAGDRGYQTLINQALHQVMACDQIAGTLRRVIREELRG